MLQDKSGKLGRLMTNAVGVVNFVPYTEEEIGAIKPDTTYMLFNGTNVLDTVKTRSADEARNFFNVMYPEHKNNGYEMWLRLRRD